MVNSHLKISLTIFYASECLLIKLGSNACYETPNTAFPLQKPEHFNFPCLQDGPHAGQTVPHVHIHILPRTTGDFEKNDEIYDALDEKEKELKQKLDLDKERKDRSYEEMAQEAAEYRKLFT
ncbi:hypothetical protein MKW94_000535 [Papaver nudicaule]|uniref:HIT domain-containing protein n=1 Tax=Papaver nudicaule TaxID=74823 RepID=A0AA41VIE8_PAPNU|nr:hypothetical protein [Papaver nudicaule]